MKPDYVVFCSVNKLFLLLRKLTARTFTRKQALQKHSYFLCFVDLHLEYNRVKKIQLDVQLILSKFRQPLHVSGVSRPIIKRYNRMYTAVGTYCSL